MAKLMGLLALMIVAVAPAAAIAEPSDVIGLYRLDTDKKLEIYGQAVATELARALTAGGLDVVVIGANENTPAKVKLVVGGKLESKGAGVVMSLAVRDLVHGVTTDEMTATAPAITNIDRVAADLSERLLTTIKGRLTAMRATAVPPPIDTTKTAPPPKPKLALVAIVASGLPADEPLRQALVGAITPWTQHHGREARIVDPKSLTRELAVKTVAASSTDLAILVEVAELVIESGEVPMAHARVKVRIADAQNVIFDRTVVTDTVIGDKGMAPGPLVARAARSVLAIIAPAIHRKVSGWRAGD